VYILNRIEMLIESSNVGDVCASINKIDGGGIMITEINSHHGKSGLKQSARRARTRVRLIVTDEAVNNVLGTICRMICSTPKGGSKISIYHIDNADLGTRQTAFRP
jgi:nitrogen regulatory protein PII